MQFMELVENYEAGLVIAGQWVSWLKKKIAQ